MTLTLRAVSLNHAALTQPITARFDTLGGTIGRSDQNTMALPDPERIISRRHAQISIGDRGFMITNIGTANPILVRNQLLARGETVPLRHGDPVRIGSYLLEVLDDDAGRGDDTTRVGGPASPAPDDPFAEPPSRPVLPGDFDPFAPRQPALAPQPPVAPLEDLVPDAQATSVDELIGLLPGDDHRLLEDFLAEGPAKPAHRPAESPPSLADRVPELLSAFKPPRPMPPISRAPVLQPEPPPPARPAATGAAVEAPRAAPAPMTPETQELWLAFCRGAGIELDAARCATPETMHTAGALLRLSVKGTLQLISLRSNTRHELHASVTMIRPTRNNPLKFSPDARSALEKLLRPPAHGFLPGPVAMDDAMNDLLGHAIGTMAGMRAALEGVLGRFTPSDLEAKLTNKGMFNRLLPMAHKARLWDLYLEHHRAIRDEAEEDFHALFGKAFLAAYEQQLDRLSREREAHPD